MEAVNSEFQQVFKVFDKDDTGEINISQVKDLLEKFEIREKDDKWSMNEEQKQKT